MAKGELFHVKHFTVEGAGEFPLDMLRYDRCWPRDGADAEALGWENNTEPRYIELATHVRTGQSLPTIDRWRSFGWRVVEVDGRAV